MTRLFIGVAPRANLPLVEVESHAQDAHLVHGRIGPVVVTRIGPGHTDATFELYLAALERELSERAPSERARRRHLLRALRRHLLRRATRAHNGVLARHLDNRRKTTSVWVLCTPSAATRDVVTALFWLSPPPYEFRTRATLDEALADVRDKHPAFDAAFKLALGRVAHA